MQAFVTLSDQQLTHLHCFRKVVNKLAKGLEEGAYHVIFHHRLPYQLLALKPAGVFGTTASPVQGEACIARSGSCGAMEITGVNFRGNRVLWLPVDGLLFGVMGTHP